MNLIGLILIAALSGGIVIVSLRLRPPLSSDGVWLDGERLYHNDRQPSSNNSRSWRETFGRKSAKDQI
jgi:hypothetical protein